MNRKDEHLNLALEFYKQRKLSDFDNVDFVHTVFPEVCVDEVDISTNIAGFNLEHPFYISGMTGGSELTKKYNEKLAILAKRTDTFMAVGSLSIALKDESTHSSFTVARQNNPNGTLFANLGADKTLEDAKKAVEIIDADGIQIHVNAAQEIVMPEGERNFKGWLLNVESIVKGLGKPVIVKEVGFGMSREAIKKLVDIGVQTIDIAGKNGTNFAKIENTRRTLNKMDFLEGFGNSTVVSLLESLEFQDRVQIIASGGIRDSLDIVKSLALGANAVAMAGRFINLVNEKSMDEAVEEVNNWKYQIKSIMALLGASNINELRSKDLILRGEVKEWCKARKIDYKQFSNRSKK